MSYQFDLQQMQQLMMAGQYDPMRMLGSPHINPGIFGMPTTPPPGNNVEQNEESDDDEDDEDKRTLFCANLDDKITEELLFEVFTQAGPIERVRIPKDNTGKQRTFGFITYVHKCTPPYAMQLFKGLTLYRRQLNIKFQGNNNSKPSPMRGSPAAFNNSNKRGNYDNSALRGGGGGGGSSGRMTESPPMNPFKRSNSADRSGGGGNNRDRISKHASSQSRPHTNSGPYQRRSGDGKDDRRDDNRRQQHYNNSNSNRRSDQRNSGGGNYRR